MADTLQIKRGSLANLPILEDGEIAYVNDSNRLYIGSNINGNVKFVPEGSLDELYYDYPAGSFIKRLDNLRITSSMNTSGGRVIYDNTHLYVFEFLGDKRIFKLFKDNFEIDLISPTISPNINVQVLDQDNDFLYVKVQSTQFSKIYKSNLTVAATSLNIPFGFIQDIGVANDDNYIYVGSSNAGYEAYMYKYYKDNLEVAFTGPKTSYSTSQIVVDTNRGKLYHGWTRSTWVASRHLENLVVDQNTASVGSGYSYYINQDDDYVYITKSYAPYLYRVNKDNLADSVAIGNLQESPKPNLVFPGANNNFVYFMTQSGIINRINRNDIDGSTAEALVNDTVKFASTIDNGACVLEDSNLVAYFRDNFPVYTINASNRVNLGVGYIKDSSNKIYRYLK